MEKRNGKSEVLRSLEDEIRNLVEEISTTNEDYKLRILYEQLKRTYKIFKMYAKEIGCSNE